MIFQQSSPFGMLFGAAGFELRDSLQRIVRHIIVWLLAAIARCENMRPHRLRVPEEEADRAAHLHPRALRQAGLQVETKTRRGSWLTFREQLEFRCFWAFAWKEYHS